MVHTIIDRRPNGKNKSSVNRSKFLKRVQVKNKIKDKIKEFIKKGDISDITNSKGDKIKVPIKDIKEPHIHHGQGGYNQRVYPGNKKFNQGDRIPRPKDSDGGKGPKASNSGEGEDEFVFELTRDEFLEYFFEDMELPDLVQKQLSIIEETIHRRAGYSFDGPPNRLDMLQSMRQSVGRRFALRNPKKKKIKELQKELDTLIITISEMEQQNLPCDNEKTHKLELEEEITILKRKLKAVPFIDDIDLRYKQWIHEPVPIYKAAMFCVMDVSGSMDEMKKELAKRFYMLLYLFLFRNYDKIEIVFIRHHTEATECDENEFFYGRDTGGTMVSPALELMVDIIKKRYPLNQYNIYVAQTSDGDNFMEDNDVTIDILRNQILPIVQYYFYIQINHGKMISPEDSDLWEEYENVMKSVPNMAMGCINDASDIYPVFKNLFERK